MAGASRPVAAGARGEPLPRSACGLVCFRPPASFRAASPRPLPGAVSPTLQIDLDEAPRPQNLDPFEARRRKDLPVATDDDSAVGPECAGEQLVIGGVAHDRLGE